MAEPLPVTVVIPVRNRADMVARAVRSALAQQPRPPAEVIVVDDASTDATAEAARAAGATVIAHETPRGSAAARNTGIRAARHDWVAFLDSDDEHLPHHLATLWPQRDGHVIAGGSAVVCAPDPADDVVVGRAGLGPAVLGGPAAVLRRGNALITSGVLARRDVVIAAGWFAEGMERSADLDLWLRVLEHGTGYVSPAVTVRYHLHPGQVTGDTAPTFDAYTEIVDSYRDRPWLSRSARAGADATVELDRLWLDLGAGRRGAALRRLGWIVRDPRRAQALAGVTAYRLRLLRRRRSFTREGEPTTWRWAEGFWAGVPRALLRPAAVTVTDRRLRAAVARLGGSTVHSY